MKANKNQKSSPASRKTANPGPEHNARAWRAGNPSGLESRVIPRGRGTTANDASETEKQNQ